MTESRSARLADIAAQADVSEATVSRVLNDRPGVSEATRQAVLTAIDVLGYDRPTRLKPKSALLVGLVMPELVNPIFPAFAQVIETALAAEGFTPGAVHADPRRASTRTTTCRCCSTAASPGSSSCPASTPTPPPTRRATGRCASAACRSCSSTARSTGVDAPSSRNDDVASMDLAVSHLVQLGHTEIGLALGPGALHAGHPQARRASGRRCASTSASSRPTSSGSSRTPCSASRAGRRRPGGSSRAARPPSSAGPTSWRSARSGRPARWGWPCRGRLGRRLRRLDDHGLHRPAAHDDPPGGRGDGRRRGAGPARRDRRRGPAAGGVRLPARSSSCAGRPARRRSAPEPPPSRMPGAGIR